MSGDAPAKLSIIQSATLEQRLDGPQILIVDDEAVIGDICSRALTNCRVSQARDGHQALKLIAKTDFDNDVHGFLHSFLHFRDLTEACC